MRVLKDSISDNKSQTIIETAQRALKIESQAIEGLVDRVDENFVKVVSHIDQCHHLIITGMGKSGLIGKKIAATFSSLGLPALFLHAAEASHGDLGIIVENDTVIAISNSGETEEIIKLLPSFKRINCTLVAITGKPTSTLAKCSDYILDISVQEEACSKDMIPTASTTATLALGDALAVALMELRGVNEADFAQNHPGGSLGRRLLTSVGDLMHSGEAVPKVFEDEDAQSVIAEMSRKRLGMTLVTDRNGNLKGVVTDGDLRRLMEKDKNISEMKASNMMGNNPKTLTKETLAAKAVQIMEEHSITSLIVSDDGKVEGVIHLHDILKAGIV
ncbi:MAG: KpsF/GutQ family sugar-phosphate isomerase [Nitrospina sp.]|jgi:arabinose-5-phosphate isomerase|nr:KpsF/GutQ family sugar-phosphate isomerase [Nitrospina sp.]